MNHARIKALAVDNEREPSSSVTLERMHHIDTAQYTELLAS